MLSTSINFCKESLTKLAVWAMEKPELFIRYSTILGFGVSSTTEVMAIYFNKNVPKKDRTYMAIQDGLEGILKLSLFFVMARTMSKKFGLWAEKGVIENSFGLDKKVFKDGMEMFGNILGTVLSFNIITPIVRNPLAAFLQKKIFKKEIPSIEPYRISVPALNLNSDGRNFGSGTNPFSPFEVRMNSVKPPVAPAFTSSRSSLRV